MSNAQRTIICVITVRDLRDNSEALLAAVAAGESFIVVHDGSPVAELRPIDRRVFVSKDELRRGADLPPIDGAELDELYEQDLFRDT